jgi:hypothetical protein
MLALGDRAVDAAARTMAADALEQVSEPAEPAENVPGWRHHGGEKTNTEVTHVRKTL